jgi:membrane fusion protein, adhesin transport system
MAEHPDFDALVRDLRGAAPWRGSLLLALVIACLSLILIWAAVTEIDDVTRADGRVVPVRDVQVVQSAETAVLQRLYIREGDVVEAGQMLMELDRTMLSSDFDQGQSRARALQARISRLTAWIDGAAAPAFLPDIAQAVPGVVASELALFQADAAALAAEVEVLERQRIQRRQDQSEGQIEADTARAAVALIDDEIAIIAPLVERRAEPETSLLALRRSRAEAAGRATQATARLIGLDAALAEIDDRITALRTRSRAEALGALAQAIGELDELQSRMPALARRATRSELRAPERGIVNQIHLTTLGGVAAAGAPLVEIVPLDNILRIDAWLRPSDIAFLRPGQQVRVKITAYDFSRYGGLEGEILRIGADAVQRPDRDEQAFVAEIRTSTNILDADGAAVEIVPGMVAEVDILAGRRSVLNYLTDPVVRVRDRAFRD